MIRTLTRRIVLATATAGIVLVASTASAAGGTTAPTTTTEATRTDAVVTTARAEPARATPRFRSIVTTRERQDRAGPALARQLDAYNP
jgi:hypothetical protein